MGELRRYLSAGSVSGAPPLTFNVSLLGEAAFSSGAGGNLRMRASNLAPMVRARASLRGALKEPETELGREWRDWLGAEFNSEACDLEKINAALRKLGK